MSRDIWKKREPGRRHFFISHLEYLAPQRRSTRMFFGLLLIFRPPFRAVLTSLSQSRHYAYAISIHANIAIIEVRKDRSASDCHLEHQIRLRLRIISGSSTPRS